MFPPRFIFPIEIPDKKPKHYNHSPSQKKVNVHSSFGANILIYITISLANLTWFLDKKGLLTIVFLRGRVKQEHKVIFLQNMNTLVSDSTPLLWHTSRLDRMNEKGFSHLDAGLGEWERILTLRCSTWWMRKDSHI